MKYVGTQSDPKSVATMDVAGGTVAPGTIQYFASDPGAGWLKCDGSTYLRASYAALSAALPPSLEHSPPVFVGDAYTAGGSIASISAIPGTDLLLVSRDSPCTVEIVAFDTAAQSLSLLTSNSGADWTNSKQATSVNTADGVFIACANYDAKFSLLKFSGGVLTRLANPADIPTSNCMACAFLNGGDHLIVGFDTADASGYFVWLYARSGDTFSKVGGFALPAAPAWFVVSPSGKTLLATMASGSDVEVAFDVSGTTITALTGDKTGFQTSMRPGFMPTKAADVWFDSSGGLRCRARIGMIWTYLSALRSTSQYDAIPIGWHGCTAISEQGLLVATGDSAPYLAVFRPDEGGSLAPVFGNDTTSGTNTAINLACFTGSSKAVVHTGSANNKLALIKSDATKLRLPWAVQGGMQGYIKT